MARDKKEGDWGTVRWAHAMARQRELIVTGSEGVAAGVVNEITPTTVRVGKKRLRRAFIRKVTPLTRANKT